MLSCSRAVSKVSRGVVGVRAFLGNRAELFAGRSTTFCVQGLHPTVPPRPVIHPRYVMRAAALCCGAWTFDVNRWPSSMQLHLSWVWFTLEGQ